MTPAAEEVLNAAIDLSDDDRFELVEALIGSFQDTERPPFDGSWREVISRRGAELRTGQVTMVPWAEVKRRARASHAPR